MSYKGNIAAVEADAGEIAGRLRGGATVCGLMAEYRVGYLAMMRVVNSRMSPGEWAQIAKRNHARGGKPYRFKKGRPTWNKGRKGISYPGSRATQFKPGCMRGQAARNWRPVGTIVTRRDSPPRRPRCLGQRTGRPRKAKRRRWIKVRDDGLAQRRWLPLARYVWERARGPIAEGLFVMHLDGDPLNDALENLAVLDAAGRFALQIRINPEMIARRRRRAGQAATYRHVVNRQLAAMEGPRRTVWDCPACGHGVQSHKRPARCAKCGSCSLEKLRLRARGA